VNGQGRVLLRAGNPDEPPLAGLYEPLAGLYERSVEPLASDIGASSKASPPFTLGSDRRTLTAPLAAGLPY